MRDLYNTFLKEQYDAARHHQTMRVAVTTFLMAAAGVVFTAIVHPQSDGKATWAMGLLLIALGVISFIMNYIFHRANRLHVEVATWARRIMSISSEAPQRAAGY